MGVSANNSLALMGQFYEKVPVIGISIYNGKDGLKKKKTG